VREIAFIVPISRHRFAFSFVTLQDSKPIVSCTVSVYYFHTFIVPGKSGKCA
jgi:hypothetical protein